MPGSKVQRKKIRVGNIPYLSTRPYKLLQELDFVSYSEHSSRETARRLHENELDVALIPASEFAVHGGYVGLDHGLACAERSESLLLCSKRPIEKLDTIYLYDDASSSAVLLRLLLREDFRITPRLVRVGRDFTLDALGENEAMLLLQDEPPAAIAKMAVVEDLVSAWDRLTGKPFVFLVWAIRPGVLSLKQHQAMHETFHRCVAAGAELIHSEAEAFGVSKAACRKFLSPQYSYYLDDNALAGLNSFCEKAASYKLLPKAHYQSATFTLLNRRTIHAVKERELSEVLNSLVSGQRLGVRDGMRIAEGASLADLGMAADLARQRLFPERVVSQVCMVQGRTMQDRGALRASIAKGIGGGAQRILLVPHATELFDLEFFENLIHTLRSEFHVPFDAFTIPQILTLARNTKKAVQEVVSRLVTAGLDGVSGAGGGLLIDRVLRRRGQRFTAADWLDAMKWVHRFGATSTCCLTLGPQETWEERLIHLQKLRALQDENPGFRSFHIDFANEWAEALPPPELKIRATMIARVFLDNIMSIQEDSFSASDVPGVLSLCFGANEVRVDVSAGESHAQTLHDTIRTLRELGMEFSDEAVLGKNNEEVH